MGTFEKGSEEWKFFAEFYILCQKWYGVGTGLEDMYGELCRDTGNLAKKYEEKSPQMKVLVHRLLGGLIDYVNDNYQLSKGGN